MWLLFFPKNNHHGQAAPWKSAFSVLTNDKENQKEEKKKEISKTSLISIYFLIYSDQSKNKIKTFMTPDKYSQLKLYPTKILFAQGFYINLLSVTYWRKTE